MARYGTGKHYGTGYLYGVQLIEGAGNIASLEAFGSPTVIPGAVTILPLSIDSGEALGVPQVAPGQVAIQVVSIASKEVFGAPIVLPGTATILPESIDSLEAFGIPGVYRIPKVIILSLLARRLEASAQARRLTATPTPPRRLEVTIDG